MLEVPDVQCIRVMRQRGMGIRQIARGLHVSRKTVRKYTAAEYVVEAQPQQRRRVERPAPKMDRFKPVIASWVAADEQAPRKQRRTARRMHQQLVEEYRAEVSEASVRQYVATLKGRRAREAFVPLEFPLGSMIQVDFGHAAVVLGGEQTTVPFIAMRLMGSTASFVKAYRHEKLEAWLDGVQSGLSFFGGVSAKLMFDNASTMVREILAGGRRLQTPEFQALAAHFGFEAVFANPGRGNEKGGVEHLVRWAQQNLFSPVPEVEALEGLQGLLVRRCLEDSERRQREGRLVADRWAEEQAHLAPLPAVPFPACRRRFARVDKTLLVSFDRAHYSVPPAYVQRAVTLRIFWDRVEVADGQRTVAVHPRQAPGGSSLLLEHYLPVLAVKPRAVAYAAVIARGAPGLARYRDAFLQARPEACRELVAILQLGAEAGLAALAAALVQAERHHAYDLESVRAILAMSRGGGAATTERLDASLLGRWPAAEVRTVHAADYAWMNETAAAGGEGG
jgi:transposase